MLHSRLTQSEYLTAAEDHDQLSVWFERRARIQSGFLQWDARGSEFDTSIMARQGRLDGGILFGELQATVSSAELAAITRHPIRVDEPFGGYDPAND